MDSSPRAQVGYLDDPYEGELFTFFVDLYSMAHDPAERCNMAHCGIP
jgi:hypothetical protein